MVVYGAVGKLLDHNHGICKILLKLTLYTFSGSIGEFERHAFRVLPTLNFAREWSAVLQKKSNCRYAEEFA